MTPEGCFILTRGKGRTTRKKFCIFDPPKCSTMPIPEKRDSSLEQFNELYFTYRRNFISIARSYVDEQAVAEDIVTDSFMVYWTRRHELAPETDPRRYVVGTIKKQCLEYLRNRQIHQRVEKHLQDANDRLLSYNLQSLESCTPEQLYADEVLQILERKLEEMPSLTRAVFIANRTEELSYNDIAERFRIPSHKVKYELQKAVSLLRDSLKDYLPSCLVLAAVDLLLRHCDRF